MSMCNFLHATTYTNTYTLISAETGLFFVCALQIKGLSKYTLSKNDKH